MKQEIKRIRLFVNLNVEGSTGVNIDPHEPKIIPIR
jgi:hypothetical protein